MKITIIAIGKLKEQYLKDAVAEYSKRLSKFATLEIIEVPDEKTDVNASKADIDKAKEKEGGKMLSYIKDDAYVFALEIKGKIFSSEELAEQIQERMLEGKSHLVFLIGGSLGLANQVLQRANLKISFSNMTFPHMLMRVILLEQVYRSYKIMNNEPYHK